MSLLFPVVTDEFKHGLSCDICHRPIEVGQPYTRRPHGVTEDGETVSVLTCVYCKEK